MSKRRVVTAALVVAWLAWGTVPATPAAAQGGSLFAIYSAPLRPQLVTVDPASGVQSMVADLSTLANSPAVGPLAPNSQASLIYAVATYCSPSCGGCPRACGSGVPISEIVTINPKTAAIQVSPVLASPLFGGIAFDPATQNLWALTPPAPGFPGTSPSVAILSVDPSTGAEATVATHTGEVDTQHSWVALDPASHALYVATLNDITGAGQLLVLNTSTGALSAAVNLAAPVSGLVFDTSSALLFGVTTGTPEQLAKIDPATGIETAVASFGANIIVNDPAIDGASHTVFAVEYNSLTVSADQVVRINDQSGAMSVGASTPTPLGSLAIASTYLRGATQSTSINAQPRVSTAQAPTNGPGPRVPATPRAQRAKPAAGLTDELSGTSWPVDEWFDSPAVMIR